MKGVGPTLVPEFLISLARPYRSRAAIERYQAKALRRLIGHAYANVPFYRRHFDRHGLRPEDVRGLSDLARLPAITRRELQEAPIEDRMATGTGLSACHCYETSGSTGEPLRIVRTPHEDARIFGRRLRAQIFAGLRPWHLRVNIGSPRRIFTWHRIGAFRIRTVENRPPYDDLLERVAAVRPDVLMVTPESLDLLVEQASRAPRLELAHIFSGANQLPASVRRRAIDTFAAPLTDFYGTTECSLVAWECRRCGLYHTSDDSVIVEVVRDDGCVAGAGEEGELYLTVLHSHAMPFVRLRLGDRVRRPLEPRPCSVRFDSLESIEGRVIDYLQLPEGARIAPFRILNAVDEVDGIGRWELAQRDETRLDLRFEPLAGVSAQRVEHDLRAALVPLFPGAMELSIEVVRFEEQNLVEKLRFVRAMKPRF